MNFSDSIQQTGGLVKYSPNGALTAIAKAFDVKVCFLVLNLPDLRDLDSAPTGHSLVFGLGLSY